MLIIFTLSCTAFYREHYQFLRQIEHTNTDSSAVTCQLMQLSVTMSINVQQDATV